MQITIGEALDKIDRMRLIVREIEAGGYVENRADDIIDYLNEYMCMLERIKVTI